MLDIPVDLGAGLARVAAGNSRRRLASAVAELIEVYHGAAPTRPLTDPADVVAYAAYRMPATYAAVHAVLTAAARALPGFEPRTMVDLGAGTGAAAWAAVAVFPSLEAVTLLEPTAEMARIGQQLADGARSAVLRQARWRSIDLAPPGELPGADLVTASYVLGELPHQAQRRLGVALGRVDGLLAVVEPGTPAGYRTVVAMRDQLISAGLSVVAPCPHDLACPIPRGRDWCHFAVRVGRSAAHRELKGGTLPYEDEKYSYVCASAGGNHRPPARILRHPLTRKGLVSLRLCTQHDGLQTEAVSKRHGETYRVARSAAWGDPWGVCGNEFEL